MNTDFAVTGGNLKKVRDGAGNVLSTVPQPVQSVRNVSTDGNSLPYTQYMYW